MTRRQTRRSKTKAWLRTHTEDTFVRQAQKEGYRSRAVYKLMEIDQRDHLLQPGMIVAELGAAPGGWTQYACERIGERGQLLATDILPMKPIAGVEFIQGDFTEQAVLDHILEFFNGRRADLVISDMAPNISGIRVADQAKAVYLAELALDFAEQVLRPDGNLLIKTFQGGGFPGLRNALQRRFKALITRKPQASRTHSREIYLVGKGLLPS